MSNGRSIGTPRTAITRGDVSGTVGISRNLPPPASTPFGAGRDMSGRSVLSPEESAAARAQIPPTQAAIDEINTMIRQNVPKYIQVPWNPIYSPSAQATTTSPSEPAGTFYGTDNPFLVLSDVMRNLFGNSGDVSRDQQTGQALVPVTSTSGGGNTFVILIVIAGIAGLAYYLYKRRSQ